MIRKTNKVVEAMALILEQQATKDADVEQAQAPLPAVSLGLRYLRKKDGSMVLQEGVNGIYTDVPMVVE